MVSAVRGNVRNRIPHVPRSDIYAYIVDIEAVLSRTPCRSTGHPRTARPGRCQQATEEGPAPALWITGARLHIDAQVAVVHNAQGALAPRRRRSRRRSPRRRPRWVYRWRRQSTTRPAAGAAGGPAQEVSATSAASTPPLGGARTGVDPLSYMRSSPSTSGPDPDTRSSVSRTDVVTGHETDDRRPSGVVLHGAERPGRAVGKGQRGRRQCGGRTRAPDQLDGLAHRDDSRRAADLGPQQRRVRPHVAPQEPFGVVQHKKVVHHEDVLRRHNGARDVMESRIAPLAINGRTSWTQAHTRSAEVAQTPLGRTAAHTIDTSSRPAISQA